MKKIITTLLFLLMIFLKNGIAQEVKYYPNPDLDKFTGTWIYKENGKTITISLQKKRITVRNISIDIIEGRHAYKSGEEDIESSNEITLKNGSTSSFESGESNPNKLFLTLLDKTKNKGGNLILTINPDKPDELKWILQNSYDMRISLPGEKKFDPTFTLPTAMVFERQK